MLTAEDFYSHSQDNLNDALSQFRERYAPNFVGNHASVVGLFETLMQIADVDVDVLILGASGTGKELIAQCLHRSSSRRSGPFVPLNCAAIPKELLESELFGHVKGAFTGAIERRKGRFEMADGGTLFLDEIGEMDLLLQSKLLRMIQEREYTPVGGGNALKANVRIVSATNQNLWSLCQQKLFREDLYYRLNVVPLHLPDLSERKEDIPLLIEHFLEKKSRHYQKKKINMSDPAKQVLCQYPWPGNVRELENLIERLVVLNKSATIVQEDLPNYLKKHGDPHNFQIPMQLPHDGLNINETLSRLETHLTMDALKRCKGNRTQAALLLGLNRTTLVERMKKLGLGEL